ncbi:MAG: glycosyltransferase family 2 protein [Sphaerochaeta sp.]|nr:glycosyltransferase family 2 protein [Sphaerochaeta sp.]
MVNDPFLTVFTPTYNRAHTLPQLYASLCRQCCKSFIWLIVDDGSTDTTELLVQSWIVEGKIAIKYYKQENGGKQRAHNTGVALSETECFLCVDSDDYLVDDAIQVLSDSWLDVRENSSVSGIIAMRGINQDEPIGSFLPKGILFSPLTELYQKHGFSGDTELMFRTSILRQFPYDVAEGEKFIPENYAYLQIDQQYTMYLVHKIIGIGGYQEDGYSKSIHKVIYKNPKSYMKVKKLSMDLAPTSKYKFLNAINLLSAYFIVHRKQRNFSWNGYTLAAYLPGFLLYMIRFKKYAHEA